MFKVFKSTGIEGSYSIASNPTFVNNKCWSVYSAKHRTTKKQCSVWIFDKRECENKLLESGVINKQNKKMILDDIYERLKTFVSNQSKLKHPNFLTVIEPFEDHKSRILFVTEYVRGDLTSIDKADLDDITITKGILQVSQGLKFLHDQLKSVHLNICPSSIVISDKFDWKITGLSFMDSLPNGTAIEKFIDPVDSRLPNFLSIDFRFSSPNLINGHKSDYINDIFSLCLVIYYLFHYESLLKCSHSSSISDFERQIAKLNNILKDSKHASFNKLPEYYFQVLIDTLKRTQESNTDVIQLDDSTFSIDSFINSSIFNNPLIKMLEKVDEFSTVPVDERIQLLEELKEFVDKFPKTLIFNKIIPMLTTVIDFNMFKKNKSLQEDDKQLLVKSTENLILISKNLSQLTFFELIFPFIQKVLMEFPFENYQIILIQNLPNFQSFMKASRDSSFTESFSKFLVELFQKSCSCDSIILQESLLMHIKIFLEFEPYNIIATVIFPSIMTIYSTTTSLKVKNLSINSFILMINGMGEKDIDNVLIIEKLIPLVQGTSSSNYSNVKFLMNMLKLYENLFNKFKRDLNKSIQINNTNIEIIDLKMSVMFDIWKLTKFIKFDNDLNDFFRVLDVIQGDLKTGLNDKVIEDKRSTVTDSDIQPLKVSTSTFPTSTAIPTSTPISKPIQNSTNSYGSKTPMNSMKPMTTTSFSNMTPITPMNTMKPTPRTKLIQPINLTQKEKEVSSPTIDWSKSKQTSTPISNVSNYEIMKPKPRVSSPVPVVTPVIKKETDEWDTFKSANDDDKWASLI